MYADRNARKPLNPVGLTAAIGINAALIGALLLSNPTVTQFIGTTLETRNIPITPPPEPIPPEPQPRKETVAKRELTRPDPKVPLPPIPDAGPVATADPAPDPGPPIDTGAGGGTGVAVDPPPVPAPVLVAASPDPRAMADFQPPYPPAERREGLEGRITVRVLIGVDGRVKAFEAVSSDAPGFVEATRRQALSRWRFRPATRDGVPYETWKVMTVRFELRD